MIGMVEYLKSLCSKYKSNNFEWKPIYPNNMPCNGIVGVLIFLKQRIQR